MANPKQSEADMSNVTQFPDEAPTRRSEQFPSRLLAFASRVDRLAELALERLQCNPDAYAIAGAVADLMQLRALTGEVLR